MSLIAHQNHDVWKRNCEQMMHLKKRYFHSRLKCAGALSVYIPASEILSVGVLLTWFLSCVGFVGIPRGLIFLMESRSKTVCRSSHIPSSYIYTPPQNLLIICTNACVNDGKSPFEKCFAIRGDE